MKSILESLLFAHGEPLSVKKMSKVSGEKEDAVLKALEELKKDYKNRGLILLKKEDKWQMGSSPENAKFVESLMKSEFAEELSRAAVETAAIVAYKGPLTRVQIDYIRGVNSSFILRNLLLRGLIERMENPKDARSFLYKISMDFLKHLGVSSVEDLPGFKEFSRQKIEIPETTHDGTTRKSE